MKISKLIKISVVVILTAFALLLACEEAEDSNKKNYFKVGEETYTLSEGYLEYYGKLSETSSGYNYDVYITSGGVDLQSSTGKGNFVYFQLYSASESTLEEGRYVYTNKSSEEPGTFDTGAFALDYDIEVQSGTMVFLKSGTLEISRDGDAYKMVFEGTTQEENSFEGNFKGVFNFNDYSKKSCCKRSIALP